LSDAGELPPGVEDVLFSVSVPAQPAPARQPVAIPFRQHTQAPVDDAFEPASPAKGHRTPTTIQPANDVYQEPVEEFDGQTITQQVLDLLEKHKLAAVSRLRIEVHNGVVVVAGEVPSLYEKQLVAHFCRQVPGVVKFVDGMVVRETRPAAPLQGRAAVRRPAQALIEWQLPFRLWHIGAAAGLLVTLWGAYSFATRDPSKLSVSPVSGTVVFEGQPPEGASIIFHPLDDSLTIRPRGVVGADGTFELTTYLPADGAPRGEYNVTLEWKKLVEFDGDYAAGPNLFPAEYASPASTPVRVTVDGEELPEIEIRK
jgi:hypothetical protein